MRQSTPDRVDAKANQQASQDRQRSLPALALAATGVVFGDIATSPLYALQQAFDEHGVKPNHDNILGLLSLCLYALLLVVTGKYVLVVMRADNHGEGGMMALGALARGAMRGQGRLAWLTIMLGLAGAALFFGDSVITPAISVLSAVEGLQVSRPSRGTRKYSARSIRITRCSTWRTTASVDSPRWVRWCWC